MNQKEIIGAFKSESENEIARRALAAQEKARHVLEKSRIVEVCREAGCRVNLVGSLRMGLLAQHRDIDLHVYSKEVTEESSFAIAAMIASNPNVSEIKCINGLHTSEHCIAWHIYYNCEGKKWQLDVIHIEEGSEYDGYFERMADRIEEVMTREQRNDILRLKFETPPSYDFHGVEYYEAVIADGVTTFSELEEWIAEHRKKPLYYWIP